MYDICKCVCVIVLVRVCVKDCEYGCDWCGVFYVCVRAFVCVRMWVYVYVFRICVACMCERKSVCVQVLLGLTL